MDTPGVVLTKDRKETAADRLYKQVRGIRKRIKAGQDACEHDFKLIAHRELRGTLVPGVWQNPCPRQCRVQCTKCSRLEDRRSFDICPICAGEDFTTGDDSVMKYFGHVSRGKVEDDTLKITKCNGCGHTIVDRRDYLYDEGTDKIIRCRPQWADKIEA